MDKSEVRACVNRALASLRWSMHLQDWDISVSYGPIPKDSIAGTAPNDEGVYSASCHLSEAYRTASIRIDPEQVECERDVLRTLRHELIHVILAPFNLYRAQAIQQVNETGARAMDEVWAFAQEQVVGTIERMIDLGMGLSPARMMTLAEKRTRQSLRNKGYVAKKPKRKRNQRK